MKSVKYLEEEDVIRRGINALYKELGPVEARRFLSLGSKPREDSVTRHRKWQAGLNKDEFFDRVMRAHRVSSRKNG